MTGYSESKTVTYGDSYNIRVCNLCGKPLDIFDESEGFAIRKHLGYGTAFDGDDLDFHTCCFCMDKIINMCKVSPIITNT